ncbi:MULTISPECIES: peptidase dimerization domain-containing protein [Arthrobacter]|uniref:Peptidase M20 dimerisation domain-containing protein n=1 Tax=Arthrobacter psychrochitiniphilus TaxID=291045 RepID=A0A2V3DV26_9MICC|nr:peptidase dimerization domain-containing protein [Arthrobacter psychrochitiniphilus]NYG16662.1 metal-dependent amidase/aminoacylase/carboxypeptidase family protein [Arthrobacter psychrochitiniphilus]PXA69226.1 hypothetical protein CVS29_01260 [Arthrobacter psychrochitiniphilus]
MIDAGVFDGTHAAMMVNPGTSDVSTARTLSTLDILVEFAGKHSHARAAPSEGINASDALTITQVAIALLRQQLKPTDQVHGIVSNGGEAPNIIPRKTSTHSYLRAADFESLQVLQERVQRCFEAAALATGCMLSSTSLSPAYMEMLNN